MATPKGKPGLPSLKAPQRPPLHLILLRFQFFDVDTECPILRDRPPVQRVGLGRGEVGLEFGELLLIMAQRVDALLHSAALRRLAQLRSQVHGYQRTEVYLLGQQVVALVRL